jgi:uncharacterized membrane protein YhhN
VSSAQNDPAVVAYRIERLRKGPRNWLFGVALCTALNGLWLSLGQDLVVLAGLVLPFLTPDHTAHFIAAAILAAVAYFAKGLGPLTMIGVLIYVLDTVLAAYLQLWLGVIMHVVVLLFMAMTVYGARLLEKQQRQGSAVQP